MEIVAAQQQQQKSKTTTKNQPKKKTNKYTIHMMHSYGVYLIYPPGQFRHLYEAHSQSCSLHQTRDAPCA